MQGDLLSQASDTKEGADNMAGNPLIDQSETELVTAHALIGLLV